MNESVNETHLLRRVKIGVIIAVVIFFAQLFHRTEYWPLTRWTMYAVAGGPPDTYNDYEVSVITADGENHTMYPKDLGILARGIIVGVLDGTDTELQQVYRDLLVRRAELILEKTDITELQIWERTWQIHKWEVPPFDLENPEERVQINTFNVDLPTVEGA
jgi:hypothetical protein